MAYHSAQRTVVARHCKRGSPTTRNPTTSGDSRVAWLLSPCWACWASAVGFLTLCRLVATAYLSVYQPVSRTRFGTNVSGLDSAHMVWVDPVRLSMALKKVAKGTLRPAEHPSRPATPTIGASRSSSRSCPPEATNSYPVGRPDAQIHTTASSTCSASPDRPHRQSETATFANGWANENDQGPVTLTAIGP